MMHDDPLGLSRPPAAEASRRVKAWVRDLLRLSSDDDVLVSELQCHEPGCPPLETVISISRPDADPQKWHLHKGMSDIGQRELADMFAVQNRTARG